MAVHTTQSGAWLSTAYPAPSQKSQQPWGYSILDVCVAQMNVRYIVKLLGMWLLPCSYGYAHDPGGQGVVARADGEPVPTGALWG